MAQMMLAEQQPAGVEIFGKFPYFIAQQAFLKQLFLEPERDRHLERAKSARRQRDVGLEQPLEFEKRLVIEHDMIEFRGCHACLVKTVGDRVVRKRGIVLASRETLFLDRGDDPAVSDQRRRAIVIKCGNAENAHSDLEQRVDEWRYGGALGEDHEAAENHHHDHNRQQPELLSDAHEPP